MIRNVFFPLLFSLFLLSGCGGEGPDAGLLSYTSKIPTEKINTELLKVTPIKRRSTFGSFAINRAQIHPATDTERVILVTNFSLTTFEIPEGTNGMLSASCGLRYDPKNKQIFLTDIHPGNIKISNASLSEYISKSTRRAIGDIVSRVFSDIPIYEMGSSFSAKFVKKITVYKGDIVIVYGL